MVVSDEAKAAARKQVHYNDDQPLRTVRWTACNGFTACNGSEMAIKTPTPTAAAYLREIKLILLPLMEEAQQEFETKVNAFRELLRL